MPPKTQVMTNRNEMCRPGPQWALPRGDGSMIGAGAKFGAGFLCAVLLGAIFSVPAPAQTKELSEKSVKLLMQYAWALTPPKFTSPDGKVIEVDKSKPKDVIVEVDVAREVIKVARLSAYAQICNLTE